MENNPAPYLDDVIAAQPDGHNRFSFKKKKQRQPSPKEDEGYHGDPNYNFNKDTLRDKNFSVQPEKPSLEKLFDFTPKAGSKMEELQDQTSNYYRSLINMISQTYQKMQNAPIVDSVKQKFGMSQSSMGTAGHHTVTFKDQQDEKDKKGTQLRARPSQQHKHQEEQKHHLGKSKKRMPFLSRLNIRQYWQKVRASFKKYRGYFWTMFTSMWKFMGVLLSYAYQDVKGFIFGKKPVKNVFLSGNFAPVHDEITADDLPVHGKIPKDIDGYYIRNGPNPQFKPTGPYFWFDGDGMLHSVHLHNGKASYRNRFVKTIRWEDEHHMERSLYSKLGDFSHPLGMAKFLNHQLMSALGMQKYRGKGTANMSVKFFQGKLFALHDLDSPYQVNPATLETIGKYDFDHTLCSVSSSAKVDPKSGDLVFFNYNLFKAPYMTYNVVSSEGKLVEQIPIQMDMPVISHDFGITENYAIFLDLPLTVRPSRLLRGEQMIMFEPNRKARFGVLARHPHSQKAGQKAVQKDSHEQHEDEDRIQWFEAEKPFYMFHLANAWEEKNQIVIIGCASERVPGGLFGSIDHHQQQKQQKQKHSQKKDKKQQEQQHQKKDKKQRAQEHEGEDQKSKKQQRAYSSGEEDEEQKGEKKKGKKHQKPYVLEEIDEGGQHQQQQQQQHQQGEQKDYYHDNDQNVQLLKKGEVLSRQFEQRHLPSLWEWRLDLATGHVSQKPLGHLPSDFPLVLPDSMGRPSRFVWSAALARPDVKHPSPLSNGIIKYDIQKGEVAAQMHLGAGKYGGQWEFIPKHSSKDQENGYLGGFVYDERSGQSEFWLVDAKNLDPAPVARVALPRRVPFGFRGTWISAEEMK